MEVNCANCGQKAKDTLGNLLVAGWVQKDEGTLSKNGWICPSCVTLKGKVTSIPPSSRGKL